MTKKLTSKIVIDRLIKINGNKYTYHNFEYKNAHQKIIIHCNKCGVDFLQRIDAHLAGQGCWCYRKELTSKLFKSNTEEFIKKAKIIHKDKYDYGECIYNGAFTNVKIYCKKCKQYFYQTPTNHLGGKGCPKCHNSQGEQKINNWLRENNIKFETQKYLENCKNKRKLLFDFYLPDYNLCIEFQGQQHFEPHFFIVRCKKNWEKRYNDLIKNDSIKREYCKKHNIKLLEIKYNENVEEKLSENIKLE